MAKVLVATEKPFAKEAVDGIRKIVEEAGFTLVLLEKYTDPNDLIKAVADVDALIVRSLSLIHICMNLIMPHFFC